MTALETWRGTTCAVHLHTDEINGALLATFNSVSADCVLEFSAHRFLHPLTIDLSNADEFEFSVPEQEIQGPEAQLVKDVADEMLLARVSGRLLFSMTRLVDPFAGSLVLR
jgi:hypothetical protein